MSYTYNGTVYSVTSPIRSISVNKQNVVVKDQHTATLLQFANVHDAKHFLAWITQC